MKFFLFLFFSISAMAQADFNGHWKGTGEAERSDGWRSTCENLEVDLSLTSDSLKINSFNYQCGDFVSHWKSKKLKVEKNVIWLDQVKVGEITEKSLHLEAHTSDGLFQTFDMELTEDGLMYQEFWTYNEQVVMIIQGILKSP